MECIHILDFETNGLTLNDIEIVQCAILSVNPENMRIEREFNKYYKAHNLKGTEEITGITQEFLEENADGYFDSQDYQEIKDILENEIIVGQNIYYDLSVIDAMAVKLNEPIYAKFPLDIMEQFALNGQYINLKHTVELNLSESERNELDSKFKDLGFHNALYDITAVYMLIRRNLDFRNRLVSYYNHLPG